MKQLYWKNILRYTRPDNHPDIQEWEDIIKQQITLYGQSLYRIMNYDTTTDSKMGSDSTTITGETLMKERPFIIRNVLNYKTLQPEDRKIYFDVAYPGIYADGSCDGHGSCLRKNQTSQLLIDSTEFFIIRQLWPEYCATDEQAARVMLSPPQQLELFA